MICTISEMVQEEGIAMGIDWLPMEYNVKIPSKKRYEKGSVAWIGFRVFKWLYDEKQYNNK